MRREARARRLSAEPSIVVLMVGVGERNVSVSQILLSLDRVGREITPPRHALQSQRSTFKSKRVRRLWSLHKLGKKTLPPHGVPCRLPPDNGEVIWVVSKFNLESDHRSVLLPHSTQRSGTNPKLDLDLKWPATCALKRRQRDFRIERVGFGLRSTDAWTRAAAEAGSRLTNAVNTSLDTRSVAPKAVSRVRTRAVVHLLEPRADDLPERLDVRPLVLFALRRSCTLVAAKSAVQPPLVGGMHVSVMHRFSHHGLYPISAPVKCVRQRVLLLRFEMEGARTGCDSTWVNRYNGDWSTLFVHPALHL